ncbi:MAG TPA: glycoside hydrolase family 99-like domain-containing protein [Chitinophagaceae bacterium]|nr:glycoside hydrolase family 99-like domain-containing protein [Chitinophagaceae bacterium]
MSVKKVAIYLPQYHSIPENDQAWGQGFTEWTNVKKATPLFEGHYQPHVPHESVGYYDLIDPDVLVKQAALAKDNGIYGFAFYHYWFNGKLLLNDPLDEMLKSGKPDFPFCYIWANENWTRRWDGADEEIIIKQDYSFEDDLQHIQFLCENVFNDKRYITIDEKPLFLVYRTAFFPDIKKAESMWRAEAKKYGFKDLYLVRVEDSGKIIFPEDIGFDGAMEFAPDWSCTEQNKNKEDGSIVIDYPSTVFNMILKKRPYKYFHCVFPGWDNTPRRVNSMGTVFLNTNLEDFKFFLETQLGSTLRKFNNPEEQILFINAWNEWGEGCHIEPDEKNGFDYLLICKNAIANNMGRFENFCIEEINLLKGRNEDINVKYEIQSRKYEHLLNTKAYKIGKSIVTKYRSFKSALKIK